MSEEGTKIETDEAGATLPAGLILYSRSDSLEQARSNVGEVSLLAFTQGLELIKGTLQKGYRLHLYPPEDPGQRPTEIYFLLHGSLEVDVGEGVRTLNPGDYLVAQDLQAAAVFTAQTDIEFLYVTSHPSFHEISGSLRTLRNLTRTLAEKDAGETEEHCRRMRTLSYTMGKKLGLSQHRLHLLDYAAYFHDVGKIKVPAHILTKPAALSPEEWVVIKRHPVYGRELLAETFIREAGIIVEQHHERLDGSGYPHGLSGADILTEAFIIAVADSYDAMTSNRPYRRALSQDAAFAELAHHAGQHYPEEVVTALKTSVKATSV